MSWVNLIVAALNIVGAAIQYLRERKLIEAADQRALAALLNLQTKALDDAKTIRAHTLDELRDVAKLRDDDGFRRD
jgi:hypothetical protein